MVKVICVEVVSEGEWVTYRDATHHKNMSTCSWSPVFSASSAKAWDRLAKKFSELSLRLHLRFSRTGTLQKSVNATILRDRYFIIFTLIFQYLNLWLKNYELNACVNAKRGIVIFLYNKLFRIS